MWRLGFVLALLAAACLGLAWKLDNPGVVRIVWLQYDIEISALVLSSFVLAVAAVLVFFWSALRLVYISGRGK